MYAGADGRSGAPPEGPGPPPSGASEELGDTGSLLDELGGLGGGAGLAGLGELGVVRPWEVSGTDDAQRPTGLRGDFYHEPDDVQRCAMVMDPFVPELTAFGKGGHWALDPTGEQHPGSQAAKEGPAFSDSFEAPEAPLEGQAYTSLALEGPSAAEAANCVHKFLKTEVTSSISKVRPQKFSIKADVFHEVSCCLLHCLLKVRIFRCRKPRPPGGKQRHIVEFARRWGDTIAFGRVFDQAANFLRAHFQCCGMDMRAALDLRGSPTLSVPAKLPILGTMEPDHLWPLVDMVNDDSAPSLQADALMSLVAFAGAGGAGAADIQAALAGLHEDEGEVLTNLLANAHLDIAYPAARLASEFTRLGGEGSMAERLPLAALEGAVADGTNHLVRVELAEAVRAAALRQSQEVPNRTALCGALTEALRKPACFEASVARRLHEALSALKGVVV